MIPLSLNNLLFLDLEINPKNQQIFKVGALLVNNFSQPDVTQEDFELDTRSKDTLTSALNKISEMAKNANCLIGHNILNHDLPILREFDATLNIFNLPIIDTLQLSPLAFPKNPYHRLLKDYKLIRSELNSPLQDCKATYTLFNEQLAAFQEFSIHHMDELCCYQTILAHENPTYAEILSKITHKPNLAIADFNRILPEVLLNHNSNIDITHKVCMTELNKLIEHNVLFEPEIAFPFLYTLAWLRVSGDNSVLAPWVRYQFPETSELIQMLREKNCGEDHCSYCSNIHNPRKELQRYFGFNDFRYENIEKNESIQRDIVEIGMRDENIFAILPTGGGKSLCYQLPALNRFFRNGSLTIIVSPLQALMKDQVDGLISKHIHNVAALNGLLSLPERADVLEKIQMGDIGLLFVSPEQFRSPRFKSAIEHRQIGAWIYDEAHCLSKWGNDFRPDYLYVAKCIKDFSETQPLPAIGCFTATAKKEVIEDIKQHFKDLLDVEFTDKISLKERENLSFEVISCDKHEKMSMISQLLSTHINEKDGAIIFVSRRKSAEEIALQLQAQNWNCKHFHAGLHANEKKDIQNAFIAGDVQIIVSTNAFGMGVDKDNVRLVIHSDIPGSLENYLQEAGRAGRDQSNAKCVLLYEPNDLETQFRLSEFSKLTQGDINAIYKKVHTEQKKRKNADLIITPKEILKDALVETIDIDDENARTKVITALAWLERGNYLERKDNIVRIFPAHLKMNLPDAVEAIKNAELGQRKTQEFTAIVEHIARTPPDKIIETDVLAELVAGNIDDVNYILQELQTLKILTNDTLLTAYIRHGIEDTTQKRLELSLWCENAIFELLDESAPDIQSGEWSSLDLSILCHQLNQSLDGHELQTSLRNYLVKGKIMPMYVGRILKTLTEDKPLNADTNLRGHHKVIEIKNDRRKDFLSIKVNGHYSWQKIRDNGENRRIIAKKIVNHLLAKVQSTGKDILIETTFEALQNDIFSDIILSEQYQTIDQQHEILSNTLLYLHHLQMLALNHGMTVMRNALTISVDIARINRYLVKDYELLKTHYKERRLQIHVMGEYAEMGITKLNEAMNYVLDYFSLSEPLFIKKYFKGRENILALATSEDSWKKIIEDLNDIQRSIVESEDENRLILAGPGSGKTRVIVHRIAYLLRVQRVPAHAIIALAYNRSAANEIRKRLYDLVGKESYGVTVMTYHGIAMRLTGTTYQSDLLNPSDNEVQAHFKTMLQDAIKMLHGDESNTNIYDEEDDSRAKLLRGYRYILVDEYQDIDEDQYNLISALAGRHSDDEDGKLTIFAVGDDDQNIYTFRGSSNQYIDRFTEDYQAKIDYLVENYRSTKAIIQAANNVIECNPNRLKSKHPITIDRTRQSDSFYGDWETLDSKRQGKIIVRILKYKDYRIQAFVVLNEIKRLAKIDSNIINSCAILARSESALKCFSGGLTELNIPHYYEHDKSSHFSTASHRYFLQCIEEIRLMPTCNHIKEISSHIHWENYPERWQLYLQSAFEQLILTFDDLNFDVNSVIHWLYDYAYELPISIKKGIFLGTMHSAKGLEFDHVFILDYLDTHYEKDNEEERRLYYVGMTRAKKTLMLCSFGEKHSIIQSIQDTKDSIIDAIEINNDSMNQQYILLSPKDIYMDYLGRQNSETLQRASLNLTEGSHLAVEKSHDGRLIFRNPQNHEIVAMSSKSFKYNNVNLYNLVECYVHSISRRTQKMIKDDSFKNSCQCDEWEVIQPMLVINV